MGKVGRHVLGIIATVLLVVALVGLPACGEAKAPVNTTSWSAMSSGTTNWLGGIRGSSATDVFAVGDGGMILHY